MSRLHSLRRNSNRTRLRFTMSLPNGNRHRRQKTQKSDKDQVQRTYGDRCHLCSYWIRWTEFTVDHVKPVKAGGNTLLGNLRPAHRHCNTWRGARPLTMALKAEIRTRYENTVLKRVSA